jgi:AcrR family transcriptional regulator
MGVGMQLRSDARVNRARIIEAATEVFAEKGLGTEIKDIADRAGVAVGTLYRHFSGKDDLLVAIVGEAFATVLADARAAEAAPDPLAALHALLTQAFTASERYGWLVEAMLGGHLPAAFQAELRTELAEQGFPDRFQRVIRRAVAVGHLRAGLDSAVAAALLEGAATPWIYGRFRGNRTPTAAADAVMAEFLRGAAPDHRG